MNSIEHPKHYNQGEIEAIDVIMDWKLDFCLGNVIKYVSRYNHKGAELEDLKKAKQYLEFKISEIEKKSKNEHKETIKSHGLQD